MTRLLILRRHLAIMWRAFWHPATPFHLKAIMLGVVVYLVSPIDLIPDFLAVLGWVDDVVLVSIAAGWIIRRLPPEVLGNTQNQPPPNAYANNDDYANETDGPIINGTSRRN